MRKRKNTLQKAKIIIDENSLLWRLNKKTTADKVCSCSWRGKRDLNPRAGFPTYSLSRGAPSPLGYFRMLNLKNITPTIKKIGAEGGIRTHVTVKSNGFQDRLVMTASIPLRVSALLLYHAEIQLSRLFFKKITQLP